MGTFTPNIGLYIPAAGETNYNDAFAQGMINLDQHDHTGGPNKGLPISSSGLADFSVTFNKLNSNVVDPTTGVGVNSTPGLQNQIQLLGILRNLFQLASIPGIGFVAMNGSTVAARSFTSAGTISWTNPAGTSGNPIADLVIPVVVSSGGTGVVALTPYAPILGGPTATGPMQQANVGNAGDVLTSQGAGMPCVFSSPGSLGQIQYTTVTATAAQIRGLSGTPISLVAAPGAGKVIVPLFIYGLLNFVGTPFTAPGGSFLDITYNNSSSAKTYSFGTAFSSTSANAYWSAINTDLSAALKTAVQNQPLTLSQFGADYTGGGTSTITIITAYTTITI